MSDLLASRAALEQARRDGIHALAPVRQTVLMDSGGYQFLKHGHFPLDVRALTELYEGIRPDFGVALDHPVQDDDAATALPLVRRNVAWYRSMYRKLRRMVVVPVIHGLAPDLVAWQCAAIARVDPQPPMVGVGGVVPKVMELTRNFAFGHDRAAKVAVARALRAKIATVRSAFPTSHLHVFGAGGTLSMAIGLMAGADSVDSAGWRVRAAYGCILAPWGRQVRLSAGLRSPTRLRRSVLAITRLCSCPTCAGTEAASNKVRQLIADFEPRAVHNLWMQLADAERVSSWIDGPANASRGPTTPDHPWTALLVEMRIAHPLA